MNIWCVAMQKGGVGKTTTVVTLAALMAERGKRTLMVDMDPQGSLTSYFGCDPDMTAGTVYTLFQRPEVDVPSLIKETCVEGLYLLPASTAMATLDRQLGAQQGKGVVLAKAMAQLGKQFDHIVIDCPPTLGILMINALAAASYLLIPVQTEFLALKGLERMMFTLEMVMRARKTPLPYMIIPTLYDRRTRASRQTLESLQEDYASHLWELVIPADTQFRDASRQGIPLPVMAPNSKGVMAYSALLDTLLEDEFEDRYNFMWGISHESHAQV